MPKVYDFLRDVDSLTDNLSNEDILQVNYNKYGNYLAVFTDLELEPIAATTRTRVRVDTNQRRSVVLPSGTRIFNPED